MADNRLPVGDRARTAIQELLNEIQEAWARSDADLLAKPFSEDANFIAFDGSRLAGRGEISAFHKVPFETHLRGMKMLINVARIRTLVEGVSHRAAAAGAPLLACCGRLSPFQEPDVRTDSSAG